MVDLIPIVDLGVEFLTAVVLAVGGWALAWLGRKLKLSADNEVRAYLERALASGVNYAANRARERGGDLSSLEVRNATVRDAVSYVVAHTPEALARFGLSPDTLAELVRAPAEAVTWPRSIRPFSAPFLRPSSMPLPIGAGTGRSVDSATPKRNSNRRERVWPRRRAWQRFLLPIVLGRLSECAPAASSVVAVPSLPVYGQDVQRRAAEELEALPRSCPRRSVEPGCSAIARLVFDYAWPRDQVKALRPDD